jgi:hypothetical protein
MVTTTPGSDCASDFGEDPICSQERPSPPLRARSGPPLVRGLFIGSLRRTEYPHGKFSIGVLRGGRGSGEARGSSSSSTSTSPLAAQRLDTSTSEVLA